MPNQLIITFTDEPSAVNLSRFATRHGLSVVERLIGFAPIYLFEIVDGVDAAEKLTAVAHDSAVEIVTLNLLDTTL